MMIRQSETVNEISKTARRAKVSYVRKRHEDPKTGHTKHYSRHPSLVLSGNWLEEAGFATGVSVVVAVRYGQLILQPLEESDNILT